jgi:ornithine carbamoyltransferase
MAVDMRGRSLVSIKDLTPEEIWQVLQTADILKLEKLRGQPHPLLAGRTLAMIFQKPSLRTRVSFEVGMSQLGGSALYLAPDDIKLGHRETTEDIALVLSRYCDIIMARVFGHDIVEDLAKYATVPVVNGLSDREHPCQILADLQTIFEKKGAITGLNAVYSGDGNNVAHSLMYGAAILGMNLTVVTPKGYEPDSEILAESQEIGDQTGCSIVVSNDLMESCTRADVIYTDVWASMGQETEAKERAKLFAPYQVNAKLMEVADEDCIVMHCLPAHYGEEIDYETSRLPNSVIFDQAENRMHAQKALLALVGA